MRRFHIYVFRCNGQGQKLPIQIFFGELEFLKTHTLLRCSDTRVRLPRSPVPQTLLSSLRLRHGRGTKASWFPFLFLRSTSHLRSAALSVLSPMAEGPKRRRASSSSTSGSSVHLDALSGDGSPAPAHARGGRSSLKRRKQPKPEEFSDHASFMVRQTDEGGWT
jgi:hypothetical protein